MVHSHWPTPRIWVTQMPTEANGNISWCLSLCSLNTYTQFYAGNCISLWSGLDIGQYEYTVSHPSKLTELLTWGRHCTSTQQTARVTLDTPTRPLRNTGGSTMVRKYTEYLLRIILLVWSIKCAFAMTQRRTCYLKPHKNLEDWYFRLPKHSGQNSCAKNRKAKLHVM